MAIPKPRELYNPIIDYLKEHGRSSLVDIREGIARYFLIPPAEAYDRKGYYSLFEGRVNRACWDLWHACLISRCAPGEYELTNRGRNYEDDYIDRHFLYRFPEFSEYEEEHRTKEIPDGTKCRSDRAEIEEIDVPVIYVEIEKPSLQDLIMLRLKDTWFSNAIATGKFQYVDGIVLDISEQGDSSSKVPAQIGEQQTIEIYKDGNGSGKTMAVPSRSRGGQYRGPRSKDRWMTPYPVSSSDGGKAFDMYKDLKDFISKNSNDFQACIDHLIVDIFKIKKGDLCQRTGIHPRKLQRMNNTAGTPVSVQELTAIMLVLQASSHILSLFISLIGQDPNSLKWQPYLLICDLMRKSTYEQVNAQCKKEGLPELFPATLHGPIA